MSIRPAIATAAILAAIVLAAACDVVREEQDGKTTRVDVSTPLGAMAVRTGETAGNTGLPVYPGAQLSREESNGDYDRANVSIGTPWFGLHVVAAEYESGESPDRVLDFYRQHMTPFGAVIECRGDVDFKNGRPECRSQSRSKNVQLVVGTEERHRIVTVKPRGEGSEFALVSIQSGKM